VARSFSRIDITYEVERVLKGPEVRKINVKWFVPPPQVDEKSLQSECEEYINSRLLFLLREPVIRHHTATVRMEVLRELKKYSTISLPSEGIDRNIDHLKGIGPKLKAILVHAVQQSPQGDPHLKRRLRGLLRIMGEFHLSDKKLVQKLSRHEDPMVRLEVARWAELKSERIIQDGLRQIRKASESDLASGSGSLANKWRRYLASFISFGDKPELVLRLLGSGNRGLRGLAMRILQKDGNWGKYRVEVVDKLIAFLQKTSLAKRIAFLEEKTLLGKHPRLLKQHFEKKSQEGRALNTVCEVDWPDGITSPPERPSWDRFKKSPDDYVQKLVQWWRQNKSSLQQDSTGASSSDKSQGN